MEPSFSFNTIISFMTNTNLQHYSGESGLSYLSQMLVIIFMMFVSAASGYAACIAFIRGLAGKSAGHVGTFLRILSASRLVFFFHFPSSAGCYWFGRAFPEFSTNMVTDTLEGAKQIIAMGPVAALEIIKHLGTNGGGFLGANSATPIENPTILSNLIELYSMMLLPGACVVTFGKMVRDRKPEQIRQLGCTAVTFFPRQTAQKPDRLAVRSGGPQYLCSDGNSFSDWSGCLLLGGKPGQSRVG